MPFAKLGLTRPLLRGVQSMGYGDPTPIQLTRDTARAGRPRCYRLGPDRHGKDCGLRAAPLAAPRRSRRSPLSCARADPGTGHASGNLHPRSGAHDLRIASLYGGVGYGAQREAMKGVCDVIVATPGRLEDYLAQGTLRLDSLEIVVLDEVDRMLDVGFLPAVKRILSQCPSKRQTLFFSATLPPEIADLAAWALRDPTRVEIGAGRP